MTASLFSDMMPHTATYWPAGLADGFGGTGFGTPVEASCRWQPSTSLVRTGSGDQIQVSTTVYVNYRVAKGGWMALGSFSDADPRNVAGASEIMAVTVSPSLDGTVELVKAYLR